MQIYIIPPLANPELMAQGDRIFVLCQHYLKNEGYRKAVKAYQAENYWITLDNGAGDHDIISPQELLEVTKELMPNEVIPLDILFDAEQTLKNLDEFIEMMREAELLDEVEIFSCPQGATKEDWLHCYKQMLANPHVRTIGFSKIAVPHAWGTGKEDQGIMEGRHACYDELMVEDLIQKPIHCLGAGDPREFLKYKNNPLMRSTDSCFSVLAGMNNISWKDGDFTRIKTPTDYFHRTVGSAQEAIALSNIEFLRQIVTNTTDNE